MNYRAMRRAIFVMTGVLLALTMASCNVRPVETAPEGGTPPIRTPVGPTPGPERAQKVSTNPYGQDRVALAEGRRLFGWYNCAGCHGGRAGGGMGPSLRDEVWIYGNSDAHIFGSIAEGRANGMPAWGTKLPEEQIWKLTAYVKSLRTPLEPQPPKP